jgi:glycerol kinase
VPAFTGLGAPYWDPAARGAVFGLTRGSGRAQLARAALEGIAMQVADVCEAMGADLGAPLAELRVDGGAAANNLLLQLQSDFLHMPLSRSASTEATAAGVAALAGLGAGVWSGRDALARLWREDRRFLPAQSPSDIRMRRARWQAAVRATRLLGSELSS